MRRSHLRIASCLVTGLLLWAPPGATQQCDRPDIIDALPADGASEVPTNARLIAHYDPRAEYLGEPVRFGVAGEELVEIPAFFNENEGLVEATPEQPLDPGETYRVEWPRLRGVGTASLGSGLNAEFTVGDVEDTEPPRFAGVENVTWRVDRERDDCIDRRDERLLFEIALAEASDDGGRESLSLILFQTAGPNIDESSAASPIQVRTLPEENRTSVRLPVDDAVGRVCFAAIVRDLGGLVSASGSREACTTTRRPPLFQGCSFRSFVDTPHGTEAWALAGLVMGIVMRRRRRRTCARISGI